MAASEHTPHWSLSQFGPGDRPSWIDDYNADMQTLDTAVMDAQREAVGAKLHVSAAQSSIQQISQQMDNVQNTMLTADEAATMFATKDELSSMSGGVDMQFYHSNSFQTAQFYSDSSYPADMEFPPLKKSVGEECTTVDSSGKLIINKTGVYLIDCNFNFTDFSGEADENFVINPETSNSISFADRVFSYFSTMAPPAPTTSSGPYISCRVSPIVLTVDTAPMEFWFQVSPLQLVQGARTMKYGRVSCVVMRLHK